VNVETEAQSKQWMLTYSPNKLKNFKQTPACQKADGKCSLVMPTADVSCETRIKLFRVIQNKRNGMITSSAALLHDNERPHADARPRTLLELFNLELFDLSPYNPDLTPSYYHMFTYLPELVRISAVQQY
jgi:hypothetical protein